MATTKNDMVGYPIESACPDCNYPKPEVVTVDMLGDIIEDAMAARSFEKNTLLRARYSPADSYARYIMDMFPNGIVFEKQRNMVDDLVDDAISGWRARNGIVEGKK